MQIQSASLDPKHGYEDGKRRQPLSMSTHNVTKHWMRTSGQSRMHATNVRSESCPYKVYHSGSQLWIHHFDSWMSFKAPLFSWFLKEEQLLQQVGYSLCLVSIFFCFSWGVSLMVGGSVWQLMKLSLNAHTMHTSAPINTTSFLRNTILEIAHSVLFCFV